MTYKTLRRKSDGQWMRYNYTCISEVTYPAPTPVSVGSKIDWSLYELVEVAVIPVDGLPSDIEAFLKAVDETRKSVCKQVNQLKWNTDYRVEVENLLTMYDQMRERLYKSQILKP